MDESRRTKTSDIMETVIMYSKKGIWSLYVANRDAPGKSLS